MLINPLIIDLWVTYPVALPVLVAIVTTVILFYAREN